MKYVGAVSYHCWTGGNDQIISRWGTVAQQFKLPLYVAEGGTDPASYRYRFLFLEPWYALDEINLYVRCMALCVRLRFCIGNSPMTIRSLLAVATGSPWTDPAFL